MAVSPAPLSLPVAALQVPWPRIERFVGLLTHDLRNGLNSIELQLTLLGEISDDPEVRTEVKRVRSSVADLTRQLHAVRLATAPPQPHVFPYPAADFIEDFRERFDRQDPDAAARVEWVIDAGEAALAVDPELSMAALLELLSNATRFAEDDTPIRVRAGGDAAGMTFSITESLASPLVDSPGDWGRLPLLSARRDGYGLGVFRARRIIEAGNGTLDFAYTAGDRTLATTVVLPVATPGEPTS